MYYLRAEQSFDSAHFLKGYEGKCSNIHGHRWIVQVEIASDSLTEKGPKRGMLVDFGELKDALKVLCDQLDHCLIYEKGSLKAKTVEALQEEDFRMIEVPFIPTAENFAAYFYHKLGEEHYPVNRVEVYETPKNCAVYGE